MDFLLYSSHSDLLVLRNIVSTVNLCTKLDLKKIALQARNAEYNPKVNIDMEWNHEG